MLSHPHCLNRSFTEVFFLLLATNLAALFSTTCRELRRYSPLSSPTRETDVKDEIAADYFIGDHEAHLEVSYMADHIESIESQT